MDQSENIIWAFDLDGTIADYGEPVEHRVAECLNKLGHIHIISGGTQDVVERATKLIESKSIHAVRGWRGNSAIDVAKIVGRSKRAFLKSEYCQKVRLQICLALRHSFHSEIYIGGRSTIDVMPMRNKGHVIKKLQGNGGKVVYFYDCKWMMNEEFNNDAPAVKEAWKSIRTDPKNVVRDVRECLKIIT